MQYCQILAFPVESFSVKIAITRTVCQFSIGIWVFNWNFNFLLRHQFSTHWYFRNYQLSIEASVFSWHFSFYWKLAYPISVFYWTSAFRLNFNFLMRREFYVNTLGFSWNFNILLSYEFSTNISLSINTNFSFLLVLQVSVKISVSYWDMSFLLILQFSTGTSGSF